MISLPLMDRTTGSSLVLQAALFLAATLVLLVLGRRLLFHPLSSFPGPWFNAVSEIPEARHLISGRQHAYHRRLHEQYGPVVRVSPNELIFCGANAWDDIYGNKRGKGDMEKSPLQAGGLPPGQSATALTLARQTDHARQRKAFAYPFSNTALLQQEPLIQKYVDQLIGALAELADGSQPANMAAWFTYTAFDIIGDLCFAEPFGCLDAGSETEWSTSVVHIAIAGTFEQATRRVAGVGTFLQAQMAKWLIPGLYRKWRILHFTNSTQKTRRRFADKDRDHKDFIYYILQNNEAKSLLSELEIIMNSALFIGAGSDTTAIMLTAWLSLMLTNREAYEKLVREIRGAFSSAEDITWNSVKDLPYLGACISETFRVCPPVPANLCRVTPSEGAMVDGRWVPGGTTVSVSPWAATHLPLNFSEPLVFAPERWFESERARFPRHEKEASQPFSYGPRGCIGKNLSYIEQRLIICHLLWSFDIEPARGAEMARKNGLWAVGDDMRHMKAYLVWKKPDLWVQLSRARR